MMLRDSVMLAVEILYLVYMLQNVKGVFFFFCAASIVVLYSALACSVVRGDLYSYFFLLLTDDPPPTHGTNCMYNMTHGVVSNGMVWYGRLFFRRRRRPVWYGMVW